MKSAINLTDDDQKCPFCGAPGNLAAARTEDGEWAVECLQCGAQGPLMKDPAEAIDAWNMRKGGE